MLITIMFAIIGAMIHPGPIYWIVFGLYALYKACEILYDSYEDEEKENEQ